MIPGISDVKTIVAHAGCADGITAAYLVKRAISRGFNPEVKFVQYNTIEHDNLEATKGMLFVDMTPPRARVQEFVDVGAIVLDHHEGARDIVAAFGDRGIFGENSRLESGAMLAYLHVVASMGVHDSRLHDIAMMAAVRDTFKKDHQYWSQSCAYREGLLAIFDGTMSSIVTHFDRIIVTGESLSSPLVARFAKSARRTSSRGSNANVRTTNPFESSRQRDSISCQTWRTNSPMSATCSSRIQRSSRTASLA